MTREDGGLRFAANLKWLFTDLPLEDRFGAAAAHGFRAIEYPDPYTHSIGEFGRMAAQAGLQVALINTPPRSVDGRVVTGIACDPALRSEFRAGVERGLEFAAGLGSPLLHVVAGPVPPGVTRERAWAQFIVNIAWAADAARDSGITLLLEAQNHTSSPGFVLTTQSQAVAVIEAVASPQVKLLFDVFHVQVQEGSVTENLREHAEHIGHVQIADPPGRTEPGTGELSWPHLFGELTRMDYAGWVGCEYRSTTPQGLYAETLMRMGEHNAV